VENLKADYKRLPLGVVIESHLNPQKGNMATVLVRTGTLKEGQDILVGSATGRVRRLEDFKGRQIKEAGPSMPASIIGLPKLPNVNDVMQGATDLKSAKISQKEMISGEIIGDVKKFDAQALGKSIEDKNIKKLNIILKTDVQGSLEALEQILSAIKSEEVGINYIRQAVGDITESDVKIGQTSNAIIFGFNVQPTTVAKRLANLNNVEIKSYRVIYELVEDIKKRLEEMLGEDIVRTDIGKLKVLAIFMTGKKEMIVGGKIVSGKMKNGENIEIMRDEKILGRGKIKNLQQNKINVDEVAQGNECGITFEGETKIKEGDFLICFHEEVVKKKL